MITFSNNYEHMSAEGMRHVGFMYPINLGFYPVGFIYGKSIFVYSVKGILIAFYIEICENSFRFNNDCRTNSYISSLFFSLYIDTVNLSVCLSVCLSVRNFIKNGLTYGHQT